MPVCPRCKGEVRCISADWAPKKLYLCSKCQEVLHEEQLRVAQAGSQRTNA